MSEPGGKFEAFSDDVFEVGREGLRMVSEALGKGWVERSETLDRKIDGWIEQIAKEPDENVTRSMMRLQEILIKQRQQALAEMQFAQNMKRADEGKDQVNGVNITIIRGSEADG